MIQLKDIKKYEAYIIEKRRDIHAHPETGFQEFRTSELIKQELNSFGFEVIDGVGITGVIGILKGNKQGKTIALRADIDALNMQEELETEYKSQNDGVMHSCGHDTHTAMLLGAAKYFSEHKDEVNGTIKFIFQSAEEGPMPGGGRYVIDGGHLKDVDGVFGLHIVTKYPVGQVAIKKGPAMAAPDEFRIKVIGVGTHASAPQTGVDPIVIAAEIITSLQTITSRSISPVESAVVSVCTINGGSAFNIIPESVEFTGTVRSLTPQIREHVFSRIKKITEGICTMYGAKGIVEIIPAYPPLINDPEMSEFVLGIARKLLPEDQVVELTTPSMGGEDFSYYLQEKPGAYFWLGGKKPTEKQLAYNHNPLFDPDEDAFIVGTCMHINIVKEFLK